MTMRRTVYNIKLGLFEYFNSNLTLGENYDVMGKTFLVEELFNNNFGLCYSLTPDESFKISIKDYVSFSAHFEQGTKIPLTEVIFTSPAEKFEFLFFYLGQVSRFTIPFQAGATIGVVYHQLIWTYLSSFVFITMKKIPIHIAF